MIFRVKAVSPNHDLVLVRRIDPNKTPSGLSLALEKSHESNLVRIEAVGPGLDTKPETKPKCKVGEFWLVARYIGTVITMDSVDYVLVKWADCLAKIELADPSLFSE